MVTVGTQTASSVSWRSTDSQMAAALDGIGEVEHLGLLHLAVEGRVAVVAVAVAAAAGEELGDVGRGVGVVGDPVAVGRYLHPLPHGFGDRGDRDEMHVDR